MSKQDNNNPSEETDVNINNSNDAEFKVSKEDFEKLQELEANKSIALKKEREERATEKAELEEFRKARSESLEKDKLKKWKFEEVISEKDSQIAELSEKAWLYDKYITEKAETLTKELAELTNAIAPELLEENQFILDDLTDEKKVKFLRKLSEKKDNNFDNKSNDWERQSWKTDYEEAKAKWDVMWMLKHKK